MEKERVIRKFGISHVKSSICCVAKMANTLVLKSITDQETRPIFLANYQLTTVFLAKYQLTVNPIHTLR